MRALFVALIPIGLLAQATNEVRSSAANFSIDLKGEADKRPNTWGTASYFVWKVPFSVPTGTRVRILRAYGDFLIWPKGKPPEGTHAGALLSLHTSSLLVAAGECTI